MLVIDRFEGDWVVVEWDGRRTFNLPRQLLPENAKEGDALEISIIIDEQTTLSRMHKVKKLAGDVFEE